MVAEVKNTCCGSLGQFIYSLVRCLEHLPLLGHLIALVHAMYGDRSRAERAACKATIGIILGIFNIFIEAADELSRQRSERTHYLSLTTRTDWMKRYQDKKMEDLCIPATHQSATYNIYKKLSCLPLIGGWSKCQRLNIEDQLYGGIRLLDLRVTQDDQKKVWLHHNVIWCVSLQEVLETVRRFVDKFPSEVVSLHFNNDGQPINWGRVDEDIITYIGEDKIVSGVHSHNTIGEMTSRGENVIIFNVPYAHYSWTTPDNRWPNTARPSVLFDDLETYIKDHNDHKPPGLFWYKAECTPDCPLITRDLGGLMGLWVASKTDEKLEFIDGMSGVANHGVDLILEAEANIPFNFLSTDYAHDGIIQKIISSNDSTSSFGINTNQGSMNDPTYNTSVITSHNVELDMQSSMTGSERSSLMNSFNKDSATTGVSKGVSYKNPETIITVEEERTIQTPGGASEQVTLIRESTLTTTSSVL